MDGGPEEEAPCVFPDVLEGALVMHERAGEARSGSVCVVLITGVGPIDQLTWT